MGDPAEGHARDPVGYLGSDVSALVLVWLDDRDLAAASRACRLWRSACAGDPLWLERTSRAFPYALCSKPDNYSWRSWYRVQTEVSRFSEFVVDASAQSVLVARRRGADSSDYVVEKPKGWWWANCLSKLPMRCGVHKYTFVLESHGEIEGTKCYVGLGVALQEVAKMREFLGQRQNGWSLCTASGMYRFDGNIYHNIAMNEGIVYAVRELVLEGATVEMIVNLVDATLSFVCSGKDLGVAFQGIPSPVWACVTMFAPGSRVSVRYTRLA
eukprot:m51a1_g1850 hypothetical protein (270) ;mRNA; f:594512-595962